MPMRKVLEKRRRINSFAEREPTSREGGREDDRTDSETANILEEGARPVNEFHADQRGDFFLSLSFSFSLLAVVAVCRSTTPVLRTREPWISSLNNFRLCRFFLTRW